MTLEFGLLGPLMMWSEGEVVETTGAKRRGLLAYLLAHAGEPQPLDRIVDALWAGTPSRGAESTVQTYVSQLRKQFAPHDVRLVHRGGGYVLDLDANALDASRFEAAVSAAAAIESGDRRLALLDEALELWRGTPLDEFAGQAWADDRARQWTRMHVLAHQLRAAALLDAGRHRDALPTLEQLVAAYPLHEPIWAQLVVARYRCGQQADALAALSEARTILASELGIDPGAELVELERRVLNQDPSLDAPPVHRETAPGGVGRAMTVVEPLPQGVVTFLLTDIAGSTELWDQHPEHMAKALVRHEDVISDVVQAHHGRLLKSRGEGDATLSVFLKATDAVAAAVALQRRLVNEPWPGGLDLATRVAVHTGEAHLRDGDYYGGTLNRAARIRGLAAGGQVLVSHAVHDLVVDVLAAELELVGVGEHELKGLQRSENIYALRGPGLDVALPEQNEKIIARPRTSFVGRTDVVHDLERALRQPGLATLVGPGGIGKTRLALETASRVRDQFQRVDLVQLAEVSDPDAVVAEIANAIGVASSAEAMEGIVVALGRDRVLILIDNCEHLVDACAQVIDDLTNEVPTLTVLATSRVPLELPGETPVAVEPLAEADAVQLLCDRGGRREPEPGSAELDSLRDIARRLGGIPLALELTGARLRSMTPADLAARLPVLDAAARRAPTQRHVTMRAALDWSYDLLDEQERALLRRLSVFAGFSVDAADQVAPGDDGDILGGRAHVGDLLDQLVLHSLVVFDASSARYRLLEPVRQYAAERLEQADEATTTRDRYARYFAAVSERVAQAMAIGEQSRTALDDDEGNIEATLNWAEECNDDETLCRIVAALGFFWVSTNAEQGVRWTRRVVAHARDVAPELWASALVAAGQLAQTQRPGDSSAAVWLDEAIAIRRQLGRTRSLAWALFWRGRLVVHSDPPRAKESLEEALAKFRARSDALGIAWALFFLGVVAEEEDDHELFGSLSAELLDFASTRARPLLGIALARQAFAAWRDGDADAALALIAAAEERQRHGDRFNLISVLLDRVWIETRIGSDQCALVALHEALQVGRRVGLDEGALLLTAIVLIEAGQPTDAREVLVAAGLLEGSRFRQLLAPRPREWVSYIEARLDLTRPPTNRFANIAEAIDWSILWTADRLEERQRSTGSSSNPKRDTQSARNSEGPVTPRLRSLVGRADALSRLADTLRRPGLVTLVGPGGIGKTRLLEEACARFGDRFERVWRIELVAARDRASVESLLEEAILPARDPMAPSTGSDPRPDLVTEIGARAARRRALLALDNCEQLLDFLPDLVETLLGHAPGLTVLATSREPFAARGEIVISVSPLAIPSDDAITDPSELRDVESVELLLARAGERGADLALTPETAGPIASICRQLDGVPLAIELAAARLASTSVHDLAARLSRQLEILAARRGDPRHRTLRNAIHWSYELLEPAQQALLRRLGVFAGGFTLEAAEEICSEETSAVGPPGYAVYLDLAELVAKSLVLFDGERDRYRLLEPIRQFARELLEGSGELPVIAERHARWALRRSRETLSARLLGDGQAEQRFQLELDNVHVALDWLRENDTTTFLRLVGALGYTWFQIDWRRGRAVAELAVDLAQDAPDRLRAAVLLARGIVEQRHDLAGSRPWLHDARDIYLQIDDKFGTVWSTFFLARAYVPREPDSAKRFYLEALEQFHQLGMTIGETWVLLNLADEAQDWGHIEEARDYLDQLLPLTRAAGHASQRGTVMAMQARNAAYSGDFDTASRQMKEAIEVQRNAGDRWNLQGILNDAAWIELSADRVDAAEEYVQQALRTSLEIDEEWGLHETLLVLAVIHVRRGNTAEACKLLATTGWDLERPKWLLARTNTVWALALRELEHINSNDYEESAREGRRLGVLGAARASLA